MTLEIDSGNTLTTTGAITLDASNNGAAPSIDGVGLITAGGGFAISGSASPLIAAGTSTTAGTLELSGTIDGNITLGFANASATLKLDSTSTLYKPISFSSATQTLEIGASANVKLSASGAQTLTTGTIQLDGGTLNAASGLTLGASGKVTGQGTLSSPSVIGGTGTITATGGALTVTSGLGSTALVIGDGYQLYLTAANSIGSSSGASPTLTFQGGNGGLFQAINSGIYNFYLGTISGFSGTDLIKIQAIGAGDKLTWNGDKTITISNGSSTEIFTFDSSATASQVKLTQTTIGATTVDVLSIICFMAGTMIRTPEGEASIETLKRGDLVLTVDGAAKPVGWMGRQTISVRFADPTRSFPIRIRAGALADNVPSRDLLVSPDHALLIHGVLVHAGALVNELSITRETQVPDSFVYYHVELDDHSLILAENVPAETFVDNVERLHFDNWGEHEALYPGGRAIAEMPFPRVRSRRQLPEAIASALLERARLIGLDQRDVA
ncbi:Hint domain-containing protein [Rhodoblastus sp.]|uniref:Hint domain-containing protein n=1 Tax=Rhodoblastus sp. TaxID=1962975 RepID=UPI0035B42107